MKKLIAGIFIGVALTLGTSAFASSDIDISAKITAFKIMLNGKTSELKSKIVVIDQKSYLPLRDVGTLFGYDVDFDSNTGTIGLENDNQKHLDKMKKENAKKGENQVTTPMPMEQLTTGQTSTSTTNQTTSNSNTVGNFVKDLESKYSKDGKLNADLVKAAIDSGELTVNSQDEETGDSLLILCIREDNFSVYSILKSKGVNPELANKEGKTPLHVAVILKNGFFRGQLLSVLNVKTKKKDIDGKIPLDYAEKNSPEQMDLKHYDE